MVIQGRRNIRYVGGEGGGSETLVANNVLYRGQGKGIMACQLN